MEVSNAAVDDYVRSVLARHDEPVLLEMEARAAEHGFPIVGRMVGVVLELLARSIGATRVFELGSGFGYSAYWFSRAIGPDGELHLTDRDPDNERLAKDFLGRAGLDRPINRWPVRRGLLRRRQGIVPGSVASREGSNPPRRPLPVRQHAGLGLGFGRHRRRDAAGMDRCRPGAQHHGHLRRGVPEHDPADQGRGDGRPPERLTLPFVGAGGFEPPTSAL